MSNDQPSSPFPGELYLLTDTDAPLEWLVVREHPGEPDLVLVAPCDYFTTLVGSCDLEFPPSLVHRPFVLRAGDTIWVPKSLCLKRIKCGTLSDEVVRLARKYVAALVRGRSSSGGQDDADPDYIDWMEDVSGARNSLEKERIRS